MNWAIRSLSVILILFLTGCVTNPIDLSKAKTVPQEEAVVFGRVNIIYKNEPKVWGKLSSPGVFYILVLPSGSSEAFSHMLREDGSFYWHLSPGSYAISGFQWTGGSGGGTKSGRIFAEFVVPQKKSVTYIGKLILIFDGSYRSNTQVEDDYEQAIQGFKKKFPEIKDEPVKNLMKLEVPR
jgi:hypothetical protein